MESFESVKMNLIDAVKSAFANYFNFNGRARRREFWYFALFRALIPALIVILTVIISMITDSGETALSFGFGLYGLSSVVTIMPTLALSCRRLHDLGKSGAYIFFGLLPFVGWILLLVYEFQDGQPYANIYGPDPKGRNLVNPNPSPYPPAPPAPSAQKRCPSCGKMIGADSKFCPHCGANTIEKTMRTCPACGSEIGPTDKFCPRCGKPVGRTIDPSPVKPPSPPDPGPNPSPEDPWNTPTF